MISERAIINALIIGVTCLIVPYIISSSLSVDYIPALFFGSLVTIMFAFFYLRDALCLGPLFGSFVAGAANFLPIPLKMKHIACILLILYYIGGYVIIRHKNIKIGKPKLFWPIFLITVIMVFHNHSLNFGISGGSEEGGKPAFLMYLVVLGYFCAINVSTPSVKLVSRIPLICVFLSILSALPFIITSFVPGLAPYLYSITDSINVDAYLDTLSGTGEVSATSSPTIGRLGALAPVGYALQAYLLCRYPILTWLRPGRWWVAALALGCLAIAIASGFRNVLFGFAMVTLVGTWCYYSIRSLFLPAGVLALACVILIAADNNVVHLPVDKLPLIAQRSLSFLPGNWSADALESADSSNKFRKSIQDIYINEYLWRSPLFGNGLTIDTKNFNFYTEAQKAAPPGMAEYVETKHFIEGKLFHVGWVSLYDCVGIIGGLAFVSLGLIEIGMVYHFLFGPKANRRSTLYPLYVWLMANIVTMMVSFFTVFGDFANSFSDLCIYAMILSHLQDIEAAVEAPTTAKDRQTALEYAGSKVGMYGRAGYNPLRSN